jgi:hypothetical protein
MGGGTGVCGIGALPSGVDGCVGAIGVWAAAFVAASDIAWLKSVSCACGVMGVAGAAGLATLGAAGADGAGALVNGLAGTPPPLGAAGAGGIPGTAGALGGPAGPMGTSIGGDEGPGPAVGDGAGASPCGIAVPGPLVWFAGTTGPASGDGVGLIASPLVGVVPGRPLVPAGRPKPVFESVGTTGSPCGFETETASSGRAGADPDRPVLLTGTTGESDGWSPFRSWIGLLFAADSSSGTSGGLGSGRTGAVDPAAPGASLGPSARLGATPETSVASVPITARFSRRAASTAALMAASFSLSDA